MGFTQAEINRLTFKVQAGNVIDADSGNFWYQSKLENSPAVKQERILNQFGTITSNVPSSFANLVALTGAGQPLDGIVADEFTGVSTRLAELSIGNSNTYIAYNTYNTPSSGRKDLWINPTAVPDSSGEPTGFYSISLYSGDPLAGGVYISTTVGQGGNPQEVGWVWNYDQGLLFVSNSLVQTITTSPGTYPSQLDFYVKGFRYVGTVGTGAGTTYTIDVPSTTTNINLKGSDATDDAITLTGGTDITITRVSDSELKFDFSGSTGTNFQGGDGINIDTTTTPDTIEVDLADGCGAFGPNLGFDAGKLEFLGVHVFDEGTSVGTYPVINFIGSQVLSQENTPNAPCQVDVYIPPPTFQSHFNTTDGVGNGECNCNTVNFDTPRISEPTTEGNPFKTGSTGDFWAATNNKASYQDSSDGTQANGTRTFVTVNDVTGFGGDSSLVVNVYDADGTTQLDTHTLSNIQANNTGGSVSSSGHITIFVNNYATDTTKFKAKPSFSIKFGAILNTAGFQGGRFHVELIHNTDTATDGTGPYKYFGPNGNTLPTSQTYNAAQQDVFFDLNTTDPGGVYPATPAINGTTTIVESSTPANILTKHLSGVEYYVGGSQFMVDVTDIDELNANTQGRSGGSQWNLRLADGGSSTPNYLNNYALPALFLEAWNLSVGSIAAFTNKYNVQNLDFDYDNWPIQNINWRFRNTNANVDAQVYDPWNSGNTATSGNASVLIDTYSETGNSTKLRETFIDEEFRQVRGAASYTSWNSLTALGQNISNQTGASSPFDDGCVVGSNLVRADKFFKDNGSTSNSPSGGYNNLTGSLVTYKPDKNGTNPDYSSYAGTATYHRTFETIANSSSIVIASFELIFQGSFPGGNALTALVNEDMKIYIRKKATNNGTNFGHGAIPHSLHGSNTFGTPFAYLDPPPSVDGNGSACRTGSSSGNTISGSFGPNNQAEGGFFAEIQIINPAVRIDRIICNLIFAAGGSENG